MVSVDRRGGVTIGFTPGGRTVNNAQVSIDAPVSRCNRSLWAEDSRIRLCSVGLWVTAAFVQVGGAADERSRLQEELLNTGTTLSIRADSFTAPVSERTTKEFWIVLWFLDFKPKTRVSCLRGLKTEVTGARTVHRVTTGALRSPTNIQTDLKQINNAEKHTNQRHLSTRPPGFTKSSLVWSGREAGQQQLPSRGRFSNVKASKFQLRLFYTVNRKTTESVDCRCVWTPTCQNRTV